MSESSPTSGTILAPLDASNLEAQGLLLPGITAGTHRIHKRRLYSFSDEEYRHIPLVAPPELLDAFATIPDVLISRETLMHIGLSAEKAGELWQEWTTWRQDDWTYREGDPDNGGLEVSFIDFAIGHSIRNRGDAADESYAEWWEWMNGCGIDIDTQNAIMDPHFTYLRLGDSCLGWVKGTIKMRYRGLKEIQSKSRAREMELRSQGLDSALSPASTGREERCSSQQQQHCTPGVALDIWSSARAIASRHTPGYTVLFKVMDQARIHGLFDETGSLSNINTLLSWTDFSSKLVMFSFTPDVQVAERYAGYAKRRASYVSIVILTLHIPNTAIEALSEPDIRRLHWPSRDWKELILCGRMKKMPTHLRSYQNATLIIGPICRRPVSACRALGSWEDVTESLVLKVGANGGGAIATQYIITGNGEENEEWLEENGARNIQVFSYTGVELDSWLAENPPVATA